MKLVVFGHNDWWVWQAQGFSTRNAALMRELSRAPQVSSMAIVDSPRWSPHSHRPAERRSERVSTVADKVVAVAHSYALPLPASWGPGRSLNERLARPRLRRRLHPSQSSGDPVVLWVADPRMVEPALHVSRDLFVFDAIDDWRDHPWAGKDVVQHGYDLAAAEADVVFAVHPALLERLSPRGVAETLFNAVDPQPWLDASPAPAFAEEPRPLVGYVGMIQSRVDAALLAEVARLVPSVTFALAGFVSPASRDQLRGLPPNVRLLGPMPHPEVPAFVAACDACIVPHLRRGLTTSMDPLKLYEYAASGAPVVSTVSSPNPGLGAVVRVETEPDAFATALQEELAGDSLALRESRRAAVRGQTWKARADRVLEVLGGLLRQRSAA